MPVHFIFNFKEMKKIYFILFFVLVLCGFSNAQTINTIEPELQTILNQKGGDLIDIHIYFKSNVDSKQLNQKTRKLLTKTERRNVVVDELKKHASVEQSDVVEILKAEELSGNVSNIKVLWITNSISCKASRDVIYQLSSHPNIKMIGIDKEIQIMSPEQMKDIPNVKPSATRGPAHHVVTVNADDVWNQGYTGKNVIVAVLDSGTNTEHVDLKDHLWEGYIDTDDDGNPDKLVNGWNFTSDNENITDDFGHGTHCAGIVCGDGTSGTTAGVAPDAILMTLKTINRAGGGSVTGMLSGVQFALDNKADVLSLSLGYKHSQLTVTQKESIREAFDKVLAAGVVACAAVGNDGTSIGLPWNVDYPAACPAPWLNPAQTLTGGTSGVIAVGADDLIGKSSQGPSTWEDTEYNEYAYNSGANMGLIRPDISAPGNYITSSHYLVNDDQRLASGTSQATPCVAGVIALMLEKNMALTPAQISRIIEETAANKPATKNNVVGAGRVDALAAVNSVTEGTKLPHIQLTSFTPEAIKPGQTIDISLTFKNNGKGSSAELSTAEISTSSPYVSVTETLKTLGQISTGYSKTLDFEITADPLTPNGHVAPFDLVMTSGDLKWRCQFSIKVTNVPNLVFNGVTPAFIDAGENANITVSLKNNGTSSLDNSISLRLSTVTNDLKYVSILNGGEATIAALGAGETGSATFTINANTTIPHNYGLDLFLELNSASNTTTDFVYEFEDGMSGWTCFDAVNNTVSTGAALANPWWHSSNAASRGKTSVASHSGKGHLMSASNEAPYYYTKPLNNYLVSPKKIKVTANSKLSFYVRPTYNHAEHYGVAISTAGNASENDFTTIQQWTSQSKEWTEHVIDLSAYAGQEIYVAIRHFFTQSEWDNSLDGVDYDALCIDDITLSDVMMSTSHTPTYSSDDPYYFRVYVDNMVDMPKVENLMASAASTSAINLAWNDINEAHNYNIYRNGQRIATVAENSYIDQNLTHNTLYCYEVAAVYSGMEFEHSDASCTKTLQKETSVVLKEYSPHIMYVGDNDKNLTFVVKNDGSQPLSSHGSIEISCDNQYISITGGSAERPELPADVVPSAPALVHAVATGETSISLSWQPVVGAVSYVIYSEMSTIGETTSTTYNISGLTSGQNYCYYVKAKNGAGESAASELACATTNTTQAVKPSAPTNVTADATTVGTGQNAILLQWDAVDGATSYNIYSGTSKIAAGITGTTYTVQGTLVTGTQYFYYVTAVNANGESDPSAEACATAGEVEYYIVDNSSLNCITIFDNDVHTSGAYGGVGISANDGKSTQKFILEDTGLGNGSVYLRSKSKDGSQNYYIKCQDWNVDALTAEKTPLLMETVGTGDAFYIKRADIDDNYFKVEDVDSQNKTYIFSNCSGSNSTSLAIWTLEPVVSATRSRSTSETRASSYSYDILLMPNNTEINNDVTITVDPAIPNNTTVTFNVRVNNESKWEADPTNISLYNFTLPFNVLIKNDSWAPKNLIVDDETDNSLTLEWDEVDGAIGYNVYRDGVLVGTVSSTLFFDSGLEASTTYCYSVTSINIEGESELSKEACGTTEAKASGILFKSFVLENSHLLNTELPLYVTLINDSGAATPAETPATLTCSDPNVSIVDGEAELPALADGDTTTVTFTIKLLGTTPVNHELDFNVITEYTFTGVTTQNYTYDFKEGFDGWYAYSWSLTSPYNYTWEHDATNGGCLKSYSFKSKAIQADAHLASPMAITVGEETTLSFYVDPTGSDDYCREKFSVNVTEEPHYNSPYEGGEFTEIYSYTFENSTGMTVELNLNDYPAAAGKDIYILIRHYDCTDQYALILDSIKIDNAIIEGEVPITNTSTFSATVNPSLNIFEGTGVWTDASKWSKDATPIVTDDVIINGDVTIESGDIAVNSLSINSNIAASLTVNSGVNLTVDEVLNNTKADAFIIYDGCQVFQPSENVAATFRMFIDNPASWGNDKKGGWQFISSPVEGVAVTDFATTTTDYDLFKYDGKEELEWVNIKNHGIGTDFESEFVSGRGYIVSYEAQTTADFKGILNNDKSFTFEVEPFEEYHYRNFYLLGNPFAFDMEWNNTNMTVSGVYNGYATISNIDGSYDYHTSGTIKVGDGFMVKVTGATSNLSYGSTRARKEKHESINVVASSIYGSDNVIVSLAGEEEEGFTKLDNLNEDISEIYITKNGKRFGIFSYGENVEEVNLSFKTKHTGSHIISVQPEGEFEYVTLVDNFTGEETDMLKGRYEFMVYSTEGSRERFTLKFSKKAEPEQDKNFVYQSGDELIIEAEGTVQIIDVMGRVVLSETVNGNGRINISGLDKAAYIVRCVESSTINTQKIVIL